MELIIPDFSFIEAGGHEKINVLKGRNVVFHRPSMSVVEMLCTDDMDVLLHEGTPRLEFYYDDLLGEREHFLAALNVCMIYDKETELDEIRNKVLIPCAKWYCEYMEWEDGNLLKDEFGLD